MAMIDYGSLVFKNGQQINWEPFMSLRDINVEDDYAIDKSGWLEYGEEELIEGNYFAFAGDNEFYLATYKKQVKIVCHGIVERFIFCPSSGEREVDINGQIIKVRSYNDGDILDVEFVHNGTTWRLITGLGIDVDRDIFDEVWQEYGVPENVYHLIHELWATSDKM